MRQTTILRRLGSLGVALLTIGGLVMLLQLYSGNAAAEDHQAGIRILLSYDMEGASGVIDDATMNPQHPEDFARGQQSLISDVNAVAAGLFDAGATWVEVRNSHGYGGDSLVPRARLDPRATISVRVNAYNPALVSADSAITAIVTVAMHDKPLSGGFAPHTIGPGTAPVINGATLTEAELIGYAYGTIGIPVIFSSGDDTLRVSLAKAMPWVEYVVVKRITATGVESAPTERVRADVRAGAARAVRALRAQGGTHAMRLTGPIRAGLLPSFPNFLPRPAMSNLPGAEMRGDTVTFTVPDYPAAYRTIRGLTALANTVGQTYPLRLLQQRLPEGGRRLFQEARDTAFAQWEAFERGRWDPPSPPYTRRPK
jgi:D-amino peptidase